MQTQNRKGNNLLLQGIDITHDLYQRLSKEVAATKVTPKRNMRVNFFITGYKHDMRKNKELNITRENGYKIVTLTYSKNTNADDEVFNHQYTDFTDQLVDNLKEHDITVGSVNNEVYDSAVKTTLIIPYKPGTGQHTHDTIISTYKDSKKNFQFS